MMSDETLDSCIPIFMAKVPEFENDVAWMYLDNAVPPNVTVGIGCELSLAVALTLPFVNAQGVAASQAEIQAAYELVAKMPGGGKASRYQYRGCLTLPEAARQALLQQRCVEGVEDLGRYLPAWPTYPVPARVGALNMRFQLGMPRLKAEYPAWTAAMKATPPDFVTAARESGIDTHDEAFDTRNQWMQELFMQAAAEAAGEQAQ
jgi:hypothetical protein